MAVDECDARQALGAIRQLWFEYDKARKAYDAKRAWPAPPRVLKEEQDKRDRARWRLEYALGVAMPPERIRLARLKGWPGPEEPALAALRQLGLLG